MTGACDGEPNHLHAFLMRRRAQSSLSWKTGGMQRGANWPDLE